MKYLLFTDDYFPEHTPATIAFKGAFATVEEAQAFFEEQKYTMSAEIASFDGSMLRPVCENFYVGRIGNWKSLGWKAIDTP